MASASRITHIPVAIRTYSTRPPAARIQAAEAEISDIAQSAGIAQQRRGEFEAGRALRHLENPRIAYTVQLASGAIRGSASALSTISGPTPAGSPMVSAMVESWSMGWACKEVRYLN